MRRSVGAFAVVTNFLRMLNLLLPQDTARGVQGGVQAGQASASTDGSSKHPASRPRIGPTSHHTANHPEIVDLHFGLGGSDMEDAQVSFPHQ